MNNLILECDNFLKNNGFDYAFCGGHSIDLYLGYESRPHGDIDISAYWEHRNKIISFMQLKGWLVYEAMGGGLVHLITNLDYQKKIKLNIFCVKKECTFFHVEHIEKDIYKCYIEHIEQKHLDFIEFLFNKHIDKEFIYSRNDSIRYELDKAILHKNGIAYFAPELTLLYKSTDLSREENRQDFNTVTPHLANENKNWLYKSLKMIYSSGHEWILKLEYC